MKYTLLTLAVLSFGSQANWDANDSYLIDADSGEYLAEISNTKEAIGLNNPVVKVNGHYFLTRYGLLPTTNFQERIYYSGLYCQGLAYISILPDDNHTVPLIVGVDGNSALEMQTDVNNSSTYFKSRKVGTECTNFTTDTYQNRLDEFVRIKTVPFSKFSNVLDKSGTSLNFHGSSNYATTSEAPYRDQYKELSLRVTDLGKITQVFNNTGEIIPVGKITARKITSGALDIDLSQIITDVPDYRKVVLNCTANTAYSNLAKVTNTSCFFLNGKPVIRVVSEGIGSYTVSPDVGVNIKW